MGKRVFIGIPASEEIKNYAAEIASKFGQWPLRWVGPENLHMTLISPWQADEAEIQAIIKQLQFVRFEPFEIIFNQIEFGPNAHRPNLLWATSASLGQAGGKAPKELLILQQNIKKCLYNIKRRYDLCYMSAQLYTHMTLGRFKAKDFIRFPVKKLDQKINWQMTVDWFALYESLLLPQGAEYRIIETWSMKSVNRN